MKVYEIKAELIIGDPLFVQKRDNLGREIAALARAHGESVWFHDYTDPVGGAPVVLLECSDAMLDRVKQLPGYRASREMTASDWPTARNEHIKSYFTAPPPPRPNKCYFPKL